MRIAVLGGVGIGILGSLLGCAEESDNPNRFGPLDTAGAAAYVDMTGAGSAAQGIGGTAGDPPSYAGSTTVDPGPSSSGGAPGNGATSASATGGTSASGGASATGGVSGLAPDSGAGGSGAGGATCGGFLQPACANGGAGGAACGGFLQPACATGGAGGDSGNGGAAGADQCANETCFDIFDCYLYFPNASACKFTKCEGLICKP